MAEEKKVSKTREMISAFIAGAIVLTSIVYWIIQIEGVRQMLKLAGQ